MRHRIAVMEIRMKETKLLFAKSSASDLNERQLIWGTFLREIASSFLIE